MMVIQQRANASTATIARCGYDNAHSCGEQPPFSGETRKADEASDHRQV
jgi:hypothetical protein